MALIPYVVEQTANGERSFDIYSRLLEDRIIMICGEITEESMNVAISELLYLNGKDSSLPIYCYIQSPGGSVVDGLGFIDTMHFVSAPVYTICIGEAASMGGVILAAGEPGHRYCLKSSQILVHPMSGGTGRARTRDNVISINFEKKLENYLIASLAHDCKKLSDTAKTEVETVLGTLNIKDPNMVVKFSKQTMKELDAFKKEYDYDHWMFPQEALNFGVVDKIITSEKEMFEEK